MKKLIIALLLVQPLFAMEWGEYEALCQAEGKEPDYEEYLYLAGEGATDYGYDDEDLEKLLDQGE